MRTIKTRQSAKNIKIIDKSVNLSTHMKNAFIRTKDVAEETQNPRHASPVDYATDNVQDTARSATAGTAHRFSSPRRKARENWNRAKGYFQEVKSQLPKERNRAAEQAHKTAIKTKDSAENLRKPADKAGEAARDAKSAVKDAEQTLREVRQAGRQTLREVRQGAKLERDAAQTGNPVKTKPVWERFRISRLSKINARYSVKGEISSHASAASNMEPKNDGKLPGRTDVSPMREGATPQKSPSVTTSKTVNTPTAKTQNGGISRPNYIRSGVKSPKNAGNSAKTLQSSVESVKSTKKKLKKTAKGTVKTAKKSVKTAERTAKMAVKTARRTAKTAQKTAQASARAARLAAKAAKVAAKAAVITAKVAIKATVALVKATIAAVKALVAIIAAGGWVAVLVILIICLVAMLVGSIYGIFFSDEPNEDGQTINSVIAEIDDEYTEKINGIIASTPHDLADISGARAGWKDVLAVYTVKTTSDPDNPMEVATIDDEKAALLRSVFWEMNIITFTLSETDVEEDVLGDDGLPTGQTTIVTKTVLRISVTRKTPDEMAAQYGFADIQVAQLSELLLPEYHYLWNALLYGVTTVGDGSMIEIAATQLGNVGGETYWSWYGFSDRVSWCACFVSWVADQCGFIETGVIPKFASCSVGIQWFKDREQWQDNTYTPRSGDIIFFDWENDGACDHVGIVESVTDEIINTIEGNSSDSVARRSYDIGSVKIYGYGVPVYTEGQAHDESRVPA